ncbi:hypothetical protein ACFO5R_02635 [Halosolutus amylolyticus]|uniref:Uncharacterized protein n=1 Tax=Halosolutus amylolyticus TaxID=2932267 RepID=A0ABD5PLM0_9EURY|nr:hypothetical protein [Halosolutus amylolyticus]
MGEREPLCVRVDETVQEQFRNFTLETKGRIHGEMGRLVERAMKEYMNRDRSARIEEQLEQMNSRQQKMLELMNNSASLSSHDEAAHSHSTDVGAFTDLEPQVRKGIEKTLASLPEGEVDHSDIERAVHSAGRTDPRTVKKYRKVLESRGVLLPHPLKADEDMWIHGLRQFAVLCEASDDVTVGRLNFLLGDLEKAGVISEEDYRDALPDDFVEGRALKIDQITFNSS